MDTALEPISAALPIATRHGTAHVATSYRQIHPERWTQALTQHGKDHRYYEVLEDTLSQQFEHRYFILNHAGSGASAIQPFFFVNQDLTAGLPKSVRDLLNGIRRFWPRFLNLKMMMIGCSAGEGQLDSTEPWVVEALQDAIDAYARGRASIILLKDFPSTYRAALAPFATGGYRRVPSLPAAQLELAFSSFDDYLQNKLSKVFRKNLRRKFKDAETHPPLQMQVVHDATPFIDEIFPLYRQTFERSDFHFEELTKEYFCALGQRLPDRIRYFLWRQNGRLIAFSLCLVHDGTIYDLDVGMDYTVALEMHLYFLTLRDLFQWSIENGVRRYHTGPLNYDPKLHLKLDLVAQDLYARHTSRWLNPIFQRALAYLEPTRHDPVIRRFHNAHEL